MKVIADKAEISATKRNVLTAGNCVYWIVGVHKKMKHILIIILVGLFNLSYSQSYSELEKALTKELPENSTEDGRWGFYAEKANIEKIFKPFLKAQVPNYDFYKVTLTNYLGYHVNQGTCVILFDSSASKIILVEPLWYGGKSSELIKLFINEEFENKEDLLTCMKEIHKLMEIGSGYKFIETNYTDSLITYDLVYFKGDSYPTGGNGTSSTINYNEDGIWRQIEIEIKKLKIKKYISINPRLKDDKEFKKDYKREIK